MAYRFRPAEIEAMKESILLHCNSEYNNSGKYSAFRLRIAIEGQLYCCRPNKRRAAQLHRELALFESLTKNNLPNWQGCDYWHTTSAPGQLPALPNEIEIAI